jgi:stage III sporulation protein SpoIIIAA
MKSIIIIGNDKLAPGDLPKKIEKKRVVFANKTNYEQVIASVINTTNFGFDYLIVDEIGTIVEIREILEHCDFIGIQLITRFKTLDIFANKNKIHGEILRFKIIDTDAI